MKSQESNSEEEYNIYQGTLNSIKQNADLKSQKLPKSTTSLKQFPSAGKFDELRGKHPPIQNRPGREESFETTGQTKHVLARNKMNTSKGNSSGNIRNSGTSGSHRSSRGVTHSLKNKENIHKLGIRSGSSISLRSQSQSKTKPIQGFNRKNDMIERSEIGWKRDQRDAIKQSGQRLPPVKTSIAMQLWNRSETMSKGETANDTQKPPMQINGFSDGPSRFMREEPEPDNSSYNERDNGAVRALSGGQSGETHNRPEAQYKHSQKKQKAASRQQMWNHSFERIKEIEEEAKVLGSKLERVPEMMLGELLKSDEEADFGTQKASLKTVGFPQRDDFYDRKAERGGDFYLQDKETRRFPGRDYFDRRAGFAKDTYGQFEDYPELDKFEDRGERGADNYFNPEKVNLEKLSPIRFESRMRRDSRYFKNRPRYNDFYEREFEDPGFRNYKGRGLMEKIRESRLMDRLWLQQRKVLNEKIQIYEKKLREIEYDMYRKRRSDGDRRDRSLIREIYEKMPNSSNVSANPSPKINPMALEKWKIDQKKSRYAKEAEMLGKRADLDQKFFFSRKDRKPAQKGKWESHEDEDEEWRVEEERERVRQKRRPKRAKHSEKEFKINLRMPSGEHPESGIQSAKKVQSPPDHDKQAHTEPKKAKRKRIRRRKPLVFKNNNPNLVVGVSCKCKKSRCLKLYCECFSNDGFCHPSCKCENCCNKEEFKELRELVRKEILQKNPKAFQKKFKKVKRKDGFLHSRGCNCKKTQCLKNYCECFSVGIGCSSLCKCVNCKNKKVDIAPQEAEAYFEKPERKRRKPTILYEYILDQIKDKDTRDLSNKVELAITNDYERILDEIKNNYDSRKLKKHIKKVNLQGSDKRGSHTSRRKSRSRAKRESRSMSSHSGSDRKPKEISLERKEEWVEDPNIIVDEDDDEDDLANTMEKFKKLRQE